MLPNSIPELEELRRRCAELEEQANHAKREHAGAVERLEAARHENDELDKQLEALQAEGADLRLKNGRLTAALGIAAETLGVYATPGNWVRYTDHKGVSQPPRIESIRTSKAQDALVAVNNAAKQ